MADYKGPFFTEEGAQEWLRARCFAAYGGNMILLRPSQGYDFGRIVEIGEAQGTDGTETDGMSEITATD